MHLFILSRGCYNLIQFDTSTILVVLVPVMRTWIWINNRIRTKDTHVRMNQEEKRIIILDNNIIIYILYRML